MKIGKNFLAFCILIQSLFLSTQANADPKYLLVSDIDDTLRIINVTDPSAALYNAFYGTEVFEGMSDLLNALSKDAKAIKYLSGSPQILLQKIQSLFKQKNFPDGQFLLNNWFNWKSTTAFKIEELNKLVAFHQETPFLLIGDDAYTDPSVFSEFRKSQLERFPNANPPGNLLGIYVHEIIGTPLPEGQTPYVTAFDLALHEVEARRLSPENAITIGKVILEAGKPTLLFPNFKICPKDFNYDMGPADQNFLGPIANANAELVEISLKVKSYIRNYCELRSQLDEIEIHPAMEEFFRGELINID